MEVLVGNLMSSPIYPMLDSATTEIRIEATLDQ